MKTSIARMAFSAATLVAFTLIVALPALGQEPLTANAVIPSLANLKKFHEIPNFRIGGAYDLDKPEKWENGGEGGVTLESLGAGPLKIGYIALGTPERNDEGEIVNAIIISTYYSGDSTNMYYFWVDGQPGNDFANGSLIGPGNVFDTDRYYVVMLDALGLWGASKPSEGLGMKFPRYTFLDMVQANYRLLRDHLNIAEVDLATGVSMGASQSYVWGVLHSGYVKAIMPIGGTTQMDGEAPVTNWLFSLATAGIESDPVWMKTNGDYYHRPKAQHPNKGVMFNWSVLGLTGYDLDYRSTQPWDAVVKEVFYWNPEGDQSANLKKKAEQFDAVDLWYRNHAGSIYNINEELDRITARTLIIHVTNDNWLLYGKAQTAAARIAGAQLLSFESPIAHYAVFNAPNRYRDVIGAFRDDKLFFGGGMAATASGASEGGEKPAGLAK